MNKIKVVHVGILLITIFIVMFLASNFNTKYQKFILDSKVVDDYGTWYIELNEEIELSDVRSAIKVFDEENKLIEVKVWNYRNDKSKLLIKPEKEYEVNKNYKLFIDSIKDSNDVHINSGFTRTFNVNMKPLKVVNYDIINQSYDIRLAFNQEVNVDEKLRESIKVLSENGISLMIEIVQNEENKKEIVIRMIENLIPGTQYKLRIRGNIQSAQNNIMLDSFVEEFKVNKIELDKKLGLGRFESKRISNERDYEWYLNQDDSGEFAINNSGPAVAAMVLKWKNERSNTTIKRAREIYYPEGDDWFIVTLMSFFDEFKIKAVIKENIESLRIRKEIDNGNILVAYIDSKYISLQKEPEAVTGRFIEETPTHYVIIKGYVIVDNTVYFEVYEPYNGGQDVSINQPKGKNRYYKADELMESIEKSWNKTVIIKK